MSNYTCTHIGGDRRQLLGRAVKATLIQVHAETNFVVKRPITAFCNFPSNKIN